MLEKSGKKVEHCGGIVSQVVTDYNKTIESFKETSNHGVKGNLCSAEVRWLSFTLS